MNIRERQSSRKRKPVTLKIIADHVGLAPCSISAVLNNSPAARGIPQHTKDRVLRAASQLKYQPNFAARSLRTRRTHTVAVVSRDLGSVHFARALSSIERGVRKRGYLLIVAAWNGPHEALCDRVLELRQRGVEGLILIDAILQPGMSLPVVALEIDETPRLESGIADGRNTQTQGETAAHTLMDQIEALARVGSSSPAIFWRAPFSDMAASPS